MEMDRPESSPIPEMSLAWAGVGSVGPETQRPGVDVTTSSNPRCLDLTMVPLFNCGASPSTQKEATGGNDIQRCSREMGVTAVEPPWPT